MSPHQGRTLKGRGLETWLRGKRVYSLRSANGEFGRDGQFNNGPLGQLLLKSRRNL